MVRMCVYSMFPGPEAHGVRGVRQEGGLQRFCRRTKLPRYSPPDPPAWATAPWLFNTHGRLGRKVVVGLAEAHGAAVDTPACPPTMHLLALAPTAPAPRTQAPGGKNHAQSPPRVPLTRTYRRLASARTR